MRALRRKAEPDVAALRRQLDDLVAEVEALDGKLNEATHHREAIAARLAGVGEDLAERWHLEEQLVEAEEACRQAVANKRRPAERLGALRAVLSPVIEHEREVVRRSAKLPQLEQLLEAHALLVRVGTIVAETRSASRRDGVPLEFPTAMRKLDAIVAHWDGQLAPQIRRQLVEDRQFVATAGDQ